MVIDQTLLGIVWAETARLQAPGGDATSIGHLQGVVAKLAARALAGGVSSQFAKPTTLPPVGSPQAQCAETLISNVGAALAEAKNDLPKQAVLWHLDGAGRPRLDIANLPNSARWIIAGQVTRTSDFSDATGQALRLYETDADPATGTPSYVSSLTGSGIAAPVAPNKRVSVPWILGIAASLLFIYAAAVTMWSGRTLALSQNLIAGSMPHYTAAFLQQLRTACASTRLAVCEGDTVTTSSPDANIQAAIKNCTIQQDDRANKEASRTATPMFCLTTWQTAMNFANSSLSETALGRLFPAFFGWNIRQSAVPGLISLGWPMAMMMAGIVGLGIALGLGTKGEVFGIWINEQKRMSLARAQVSVWTVVILGGYTAVALFNAGMVGGLVRYVLALPDKMSLLAPFPSLPSALLAALGISVASPMISALIMKNKPKAGNVTVDLAGSDARNDGVLRFFSGKTSGLAVNATEQQASLADLFLGEEEANKSIVDISRLQNVIFTTMLSFGYGAFLFGIARDIDYKEVFDALSSGHVLLASLPDPGSTFTELLGLSHATYLVTKAAPKT